MKKKMEVPHNKTVRIMAGSKQPEQFRLPKDPKVEVEKSTMNDYLGFPRFVTGIKSLAGVLEVSSSTVNRWKASGLLMMRPIRTANTYCLTYMGCWISYG